MGSQVSPLGDRRFDPFGDRNLVADFSSGGLATMSA